MTTIFGLDPVRAEVQRIIEEMERGTPIDAQYERRSVDLKEEAGRRSQDGTVRDGASQNEDVAQKLAFEAACMANTHGGGALIVGVANDGALIGAHADTEWLRRRIFELTNSALTLDIREVTVRGVRLLILIAPQAVEPIRYRGKVHWRVDDRCVEIDAASWHAQRHEALGFDWSGSDSGVPFGQVKSAAVYIARNLLLDSADEAAEDLARAQDRQLLRRLNVLTLRGTLTNAGALAFVGRDTPCLDYMRRDVAGGDSILRVNRQDRSLLEELSEVFLALDAHNATRHLQAGLSAGQVRDIPRSAAREAIVNGVAHREWRLEGATVVEHVGRTLRVTSPGGFFGGVTESNILTHPSQSRNKSLTQLLADLKVAEREGIGVDRMVREMIRIGHPAPDIREISGPYVRTSLVGDAIDEPWIAWLGEFTPRTEVQDVSSLLIIRHLVNVGWVDAERAAMLVQLTVEEANGAIARLGQSTVAGASALRMVEGIPETDPPAWRLSSAAAERLKKLDNATGRAARSLPSRQSVARNFAEARGRISSTELGSLVGAHSTNVGSILKTMEAEGLLEPSNRSRRGAGFHYRWSGDSD